MKKNVMLTVDKALIERARLHDINISQIASEALEKEIAKRSHYKNQLICPMINELKLRNIGHFREASFQFGESINLIIGPNASGKTMIFQSIKCALAGGHIPSLISHTATKGEIEIELFSPNIKYSYTTVEGKSRKKNRCYSLNLPKGVPPSYLLSILEWTIRLLSIESTINYAPPKYAVILDDPMVDLTKENTQKLRNDIKQKWCSNQFIIMSRDVLEWNEYEDVPGAKAFLLDINEETGTGSARLWKESKIRRG